MSAKRVGLFCAAAALMCVGATPAQTPPCSGLGAVEAAASALASARSVKMRSARSHVCVAVVLQAVHLSCWLQRRRWS